MDAILATALLFTTASQLRLPGVALGPGEMLLALWIAGMVVRTLASRTPFSSRAAVELAAFWGVFALAMSVGAIMALATGEAFDADLMLHDTFAYLVVAVVSCLCAVTETRLQRVAWWLAIGGAVSLCCQFANGMGLVSIPGIDPWFWERFRGWSDNPNQLAILCLILALVALHLADSADRFGARVAATALMIPPLVVGRMTQSDTFMLAVSAALPGWFFLKLIFSLRGDSPEGALRDSLVRLTVIAAPVLMLSLAPLVFSQADDFRGLVLGLAKNNGAEAADEANLRITLWRQAIARGVESGLVGLGPGPHLQTPPSIVAGRVNLGTQPLNINHPSMNGTANFEAHNTVLDVFIQGGLLAVAGFAWLLARATISAYRSRSAGLVALLAGAAIFMMTGNILRQPVFWFAIVLCLTAPAGLRLPALDGRMQRALR